MGRIGSQLSGIERVLLNRLAEADANVALSTLRLATGHKVKHPSDDPSAFVTLSGLQARMSTAAAAMSNVAAAGAMVAQTQDALDDIRTQLGIIRTELLKDEDGGLTPEELAEAQAKIDAAILAIGDLAGGQIEGRRPLDGSAGFTVSGVDHDQVRWLDAYSTGGGTHTLVITVTQAATQGSLVHTGTAADEIATDAEITVSGPLGTIALSVTAGQALSEVAEELNADSHKTGVTASVDAATHELTLRTVNYGAAATVAVTAAVPGSFNVAGAGVGTDAGATVNGLARTAAGNTLSIAGNGLHVEIDLAAGFTGNVDTLAVSGDAMSFDLWGDPQRRSTLALPGLLPAELGGLSGRLGQLASGGELTIGTATSQAIRTVDEALGQLTRTEGLVDGFYDSAVSAASSYLADLQDNLQDAVDAIDEVDDDEEAQQIQGCNGLASNAAAGLAIVYEQRSRIVLMVQKIAGLL